MTFKKYKIFILVLCIFMSNIYAKGLPQNTIYIAHNDEESFDSHPEDISGYVSENISEDKSDSYKLDKLLANTHEYAGYTILSLLATNMYIGLTAEDTSNYDDMGLHKDVGTALTSIALSSVLIGMYAHRDELFDFSEGITSEHIHALFGLGATAFIVSNLNRDSDSHKTTGILAGTFAFTAFSITFL